MSNEVNIEELVQSQIDMCSRCCLQHTEQIRDGLVKRVIGWWDSNGDYASGTERDGVVLFETDDGKYAVFEDGEDYTGHGCQCNSVLSMFDSLADALVLGLTKEQAQNMGLLCEREEVILSRNETHE